VVGDAQTRSRRSLFCGEDEFGCLAGSRDGLFGEYWLAVGEQFGDELAVEAEGLDRDQGVELLSGEHLTVGGIGARDVPALGHRFAQVRSEFGNGDDLAGGMDGIVLQVGALAHVSDTDTTDTNLAHAGNPFGLFVAG
jgi:hypothetical protein